MAIKRYLNEKERKRLKLHLLLEKELRKIAIKNLERKGKITKLPDGSIEIHE